jgi:hypothetical protein
VTVLVLEAGQANLGDPAIRAYCSSLSVTILLSLTTVGLMTYQTHFKNPKYDWAFETVRFRMLTKVVPPTHCLGQAPQKACDGQVYPWSR